MPSSVRRTDLVLPTGLWIIPLSCSRVMTTCRTLSMPDRRGRVSNRVAAKQRLRPCLHRLPRASLVINDHVISTLLPPNDRMHPPQLFSSTYCLHFDASRFRRGAKHDRRDADIRIDVFRPAGTRPLAGRGYDSDGCGWHAAEGRRKAHGSANQIHATIWRTRLRAKAV